MDRVMHLFLFVSLIICPLSISNTMAYDITVVPSIGVGGMYNSNVLSERTDELETTNALVSPALVFDLVGERLNLQSRIDLDILRYKNNIELNTENQWYFGSGRYRLSETWMLSGLVSYFDGNIIDRRRDRQSEFGIEGTDIVNVRAHQRSYDGLLGLAYQLSEQYEIGFDYTYRSVENVESQFSDYDRYGIAFYLKRRFNNQRDEFKVSPNYTSEESEEKKYHNYEFFFGWLHPFNSIFSLNISAGVRYTEEEGKQDRETITDWGPLFNVGLQKTGELFLSTLGYSRNLYRDVEGELAEIDKIYFESRMRGIGRWGGTLIVEYSFPISPDKDFNFESASSSWGVQSTYFNIEPSVSYKITENFSLLLGGDYFIYFEAERERTRVWITFNFEFPQKW